MLANSFCQSRRNIFSRMDILLQSIKAPLTPNLQNDWLWIKTMVINYCVHEFVTLKLFARSVFMFKVFLWHHVSDKKLVAPVLTFFLTGGGLCCCCIHEVSLRITSSVGFSGLVAVMSQQWFVNVICWALQTFCPSSVYLAHIMGVHELPAV